MKIQKGTKAKAHGQMSIIATWVCYNIVNLQYKGIFFHQKNILNVESFFGCKLSYKAAMPDVAVNLISGEFADTSLLQIRARILHSIVGSEKEISISSYNDGHVPEHLLHDLEPGATFNVTLIYIMEVCIPIFKWKVLLKKPEKIKLLFFKISNFY